MVLLIGFMAITGYCHALVKSPYLNINLTRINHVGDTVTMVIINDNFVKQVMSRDLTIPHVLKVYHNINTYVKLIPSKTRPGIKDTIFNITKGNTTFSFLKNNEGTTLKEAYIENGLIATGNLTVGLPKNTFAQRVSAAHIGDVVIIEDKGRKHRFTYSFEGGKLTTIAYEVYDN